MDLRSLMFNVEFNGNASPVTAMDSATNDLRDSMQSTTSTIQGMGRTVERSLDESPIEEMENATDDLRDSINSSTDDMEDLGDALDGSDNASNIDAMSSAADNLTTSAQSASSSLKDIGQNMGKVGKGMTAAITTPLTAFGVKATHTVAKFDDSISAVKATLGKDVDATGMENLRDLAKKMGAETAHSASDAADAMGSLASAGWDTEQILGGTEHVLNLASAAGLGLEETASIMTNTLAQFNLEVGDSERVSNAMAKAADASNTGVAEIGESMKMAGGAAHSMNMDIEKTNAVLGVFANQGMIGSQAGTTFTAMFTDLTKSAENGAVTIGKKVVPVYDKATGKMRDMGSIMADVESATKGMTDEQRNNALQSVFQVQSMKGVNAMLTEGSEGYKELEKAIYDSDGAAKAAAETREDNIAGAFRELSSKMESFMIDLGDVLKADVMKLTEGIGKLASKFGQLSAGSKKSIVVFGAIAAAIGPVLWGASIAIGIFGTLSTAIASAGGVVALLTSPMVLIPIAIAAAVMAIGLLISNWDKVKAKFSEVGAYIVENKENLIVLAGILGTIFGPALIKTGARAVIAGGKLAASFIANIVKAGAQAVITGGKIVVSLIGSLISYAAQGWATVSSIVATTGAWIIQKGIMVGSAAITGTMTAAQWLLNAAMSANPIAIVVLLIAGLVLGLIALYKNSETARNIMNSAWEGIKIGVETAVNKIKELWEGLKALFKNPIKGIVNIFKREESSSAKVDGSHRTGLDTVPYNGYIAELHKDEAVLTKSEAEAYRNREQTKSNVSGDTEDSYEMPITTQNEGQNIIFNPDVNIAISGQVSENETAELKSKVRSMMQREFEVFFKQLNMKMS